LDKKNAGVVALALVVGLLVGCFATYGIMQYSMQISNTATLKLVDIGVFTNINLTTPVTSINWGMLQPGQVENYSAYLLSESNVPITLSMYTANWNPSNASNYLTLTWNYKAQTIQPHASLPITFTLAVNTSIQGIPQFSFDIWIVGSG
jgi:hypothetical protein